MGTEEQIPRWQAFLATCFMIAFVGALLLPAFLVQMQRIDERIAEERSYPVETIGPHTVKALKATEFATLGNGSYEVVGMTLDGNTYVRKFGVHTDVLMPVSGFSLEHDTFRVYNGVVYHS